MSKSKEHQSPGQTSQPNRTTGTKDLGQVRDQLQLVKDTALKSLAGAPTTAELYQEKIKILGKTGQITEIMKLMGQLSPAEKPELGKLINVVKVDLENAFAAQEVLLKKRELESKMQSETLDLSLPGAPASPGSLHPITQVTEEIVGILRRIGYCVRQGPLVESDRYNFTALNIPKDHPARDMQDTFFIRPPAGAKRGSLSTADQQLVLRTHTSPIQIHCLESETPPLRVLGTGAVFRCDSDISHLPHFHQIEGMCVDRSISMADLKGTIAFFVREFFGKELKTRFRPSFFPFTEPSAEVDCTCPICLGKGCSMCKATGWIEIGGCGLINPKVFQFTNLSYPDWQGFAFGFGIERMAIIKYGVDDIRLFPENDLRFLEQFYP